MNLRGEDRREIARQLFSRPAAEPRPGQGRVLLVCAPERLSGLCLASALADHLETHGGTAWRVHGGKDGGPSRGTAGGDRTPPAEHTVLVLPIRDGTALRRAALVARATVLWSDGTPPATAAALRLSARLREDAGACGPVSLVAARELPSALGPWLAGTGTNLPEWGGIWRPGDPLPPALCAHLALVSG